MKKYVLFAGIVAIPVLAMAQSMPTWKSYMTTGNPADIVPSTGTSNSVAAWLAKKVDVTNGTLTTPTITGGTVTGSDITNATVTYSTN